MIDLWILILDNPDWIIDQHYLLYPNPYPKNKHFKRRFHGHPVFPALLALGGDLILRSNWNIYCQEFTSALSHYSPLLGDGSSNSSSIVNEVHEVNKVDEVNKTDGNKFECEVIGYGMDKDVDVDDAVKREPMTNFERKYMAVGVPLFEVKVSLGKRDLKGKQKFLQRMTSLLFSSTISISSTSSGSSNDN